MSCGSQDRPNSFHLMIVRGGVYGKEKGIGERGGSGEGQEQRGEEKGLFHG